MGGNVNYRVGRNYEYKIMADWRALGYITIRASGSHGAFDVVCLRNGMPVELIQCKVCRSATEANRLLKEFQSNPPLEPSSKYHQIMQVKIKRGGEHRVVV